MIGEGTFKALVLDKVDGTIISKIKQLTVEEVPHYVKEPLQDRYMVIL